MEKPIKERLERFFQHQICTDEFARHLRRMDDQMINIILRLEDDQYDKKWIEDGHYYLTRFCEVLDPVLEDPQAMEDAL